LLIRNSELTVGLEAGPAAVAPTIALGLGPRVVQVRPISCGSESRRRPSQVRLTGLISVL
jgi:hypothetical protein